MISLSPGPDMLFIINNSLRYGKRFGIAATLGIGCGCFIHIFAISFGLSTLLINSKLAFTIIKYLGACYLLYLGITSILAKQKNLIEDHKNITVPIWKKVFLQGFMTNVLNPKVALFFLAFLPQFVLPNTGYPLTVQFLILGFIFDVLGSTVNLCVTLFFGTAKKWLTRFPSVLHIQQKVFGLFLIGVGLRLATLA
jgi:threonine/homoserine/homoserine lactone efflux protein